MKLTVLEKLLLDEGWQVDNDHAGHHLFVNSSRLGTNVFITPVINSEEIPAGTHNAVLQNAYQRRSNANWLQSLIEARNVCVIMEKQAALLWARIELPGLLVVTRGCDVDCALNLLRSLLLAFTKNQGDAYRTAIESIIFTPVYDTTIMWELLKQLRTSNMAEEIGVDSDLLGRFMTGTSYPGLEQAERLEKSIRKLGRQLMEMSIR